MRDFIDPDAVGPLYGGEHWAKAEESLDAWLLAEFAKVKRKRGRPRIHRRSDYIRNTGGNDYIEARLRREGYNLPDDMSPSEAARRLGWHHPRILVSNPESVAKGLIKHMDPFGLHWLAGLLDEHLESIGYDPDCENVPASGAR
jgi:hypothetical protein